MSQLLPHRFLFRYSIPVQKISKQAARGTGPPRLPKKHALPDLGELDGASSFADLRVGWNLEGLAISVEVAGKKHPPACDPGAAEDSDGLQVWIDTRNTHNIHRASRFCHHVCLLPAGGGRKQAVVQQLPIARAREDAPDDHAGDIQISSTVTSSGYLLDVWFPAQSLHGFDPEASPQLGFYYFLRDSELGEQFPTVGMDFPFAYDPSLWITLDLVD